MFLLYGERQIASKLAYPARALAEALSQATPGKPVEVPIGVLRDIQSFFTSAQEGIGYCKEVRIPRNPVAALQSLNTLDSAIGASGAFPFGTNAEIQEARQACLAPLLELTPGTPMAADKIKNLQSVAKALEWIAQQGNMASYEDAVRDPWLDP